MTLNFDPNEEYILEDDRVLLRPVKESDFEFLLPFALNEPDTWKYSSVSARGEAGMRQYVKDALDGRASGTQYPFIVFDKKQGNTPVAPGFMTLNQPGKLYSRGYTWYGEKFRGSGFKQTLQIPVAAVRFRNFGCASG